MILLHKSVLGEYEGGLLQILRNRCDVMWSVEIFWSSTKLDNNTVSVTLSELNG